MKKFALSVIGIISAIIALFSAAACTGSVKNYSNVVGKTFVFDSLEIDGEPLESSAFSGIEITFNWDGTFFAVIYSFTNSETQTGYFSQNENKVYLFETEEEAIAGDISNALECTVEGKSLKIIDDSYYEIVIILKRK